MNSRSRAGSDTFPASPFSDARALRRSALSAALRACAIVVLLLDPAVHAQVRQVRQPRQYDGSIVIGGMTWRGSTTGDARLEESTTSEADLGRPRPLDAPLEDADVDAASLHRSGIGEAALREADTRPAALDQSFIGSEIPAPYPVPAVHFPAFLKESRPDPSGLDFSSADPLPAGGVGTAAQHAAVPAGHARIGSAGIVVLPDTTRRADAAPPSDDAREGRRAGSGARGAMRAPVSGRPASDTAAVSFDEPPLHWHSFLSNLPSDCLRYAETTFRLENVPVFLGISGMTAALIATDAQTYRISDRVYTTNRIARTWSDIFTTLGDGSSQFALAGALALYGGAAGDPHALRTGSEIAEAVLGSGFVVQVLKHVTGRESPFVATSPRGTWRFFPNQIEYHKKVPHFDAFPSGHVCTTVATVTVIADNYPDAWWIRPTGYLMTGLLAVGMVNKGIHWYSDYPLGFAIGYVFGKLVSHPEQVARATDGEQAGKPNLTFSVAPVVGWQGVGVGMHAEF